MLTWTCVTLAAASGVTHGDGNGAGTPLSQVRGLTVVVEPSAAKAASQDDRDTVPVVQACPGLGSAEQCFTPPANPVTGRYLNVASFFDRRQRSLSSHFFLKYFDNAGGAVVEINGLGMHVDYDRASTRTLTAAGVVKTSRATPLLPTSSDLTELQAVGIVAEDGNAETCVEFDTPVRVEADEAAWLVVRFPDAAEGAFIGVLVDTDATDLDCDFMTPDAGEYYYRPDSQSGPTFDWAITAYTSAVTSKDLLSEIHWSQWKQLYRDAGPESNR